VLLYVIGTRFVKTLGGMMPRLIIVKHAAASSRATLMNTWIARRRIRKAQSPVPALTTFAIRSLGRTLTVVMNGAELKRIPTGRADEPAMPPCRYDPRDPDGGEAQGRGLAM